MVKGSGKGAKIIIRILDDDDNAIFTWRPGNKNVALGIRKACEIACNKLGQEKELRQQGIIFQGKQQEGLDFDGTTDHIRT